MGGEQLLLDATDRQHPAGEGHLAGHGHVVADPPARQQRGQSGGHRDTGTRPVLRHRARRHVDVHTAVLQVADRELQLRAVRPEERQSDPGRLLHHVAELSGEGHAGLTRLRIGQRGLDEQYVATRSGDRQAGGHAGHRGPALGLAEARLRGEPRTAEVVPQALLGHGDRKRRLVQRHLRGDLPQHPGDGTLQRADTGLPGVLRGQHVQSVLADRHLVRLKPGLRQLPGQQVVPGDDDLLVLGVAVQLHQVHPVQQRARHGLQHVRGGDEHHIREVELDLQVVVAEGVVLRGVEDLEQCGRRVTPVIRPHLVDLVQQDDRVHRARLADGPDDAARQRADVGTPVTADLRLVPDAAERHPDELTAHGPGHRLAERCLTDAGRAHQREDGAAAATADHAQAAVGPALAHGQVLDDALLDVIQAGVVLVQDPPGSGNVVGVLGAVVPRDVEHGVQPGPDPADLGRLLGGALQLRDFLHRRVVHILGQVGRLDPRPVVVLLGGGVTGQVGQLLADRGELLPQQEFLLLLLHALLDVLADRLRDVQLGHVLLGPADDQLQPLDQVRGLQDLQLLRGVQVGRVAGPVGDGRRVVQLLDRVHDLPGPAVLEHGDDQRLVFLGQLVSARAAAGLFDHCALDPEGGTGARRAGTDPHAGNTAQNRSRLATGQAPLLVDNGQRAHSGQAAVGKPGHQQDAGLGLGPDARNPRRRRDTRRVDRGPHLLLGSLKRHHHPGQDNLVVQGQHRQCELFAHLASKS